MTRNKYYYCEFDYEGETIRKYCTIETTSVEYTVAQIQGKTDKQILEETWGLPITKIKKATKKAMESGNF